MIDFAPLGPGISGILAARAHLRLRRRSKPGRQRVRCGANRSPNSNLIHLEETRERRSEDHRTMASSGAVEERSRDGASSFHSFLDTYRVPHLEILGTTIEQAVDVADRIIGESLQRPGAKDLAHQFRGQTEKDRSTSRTCVQGYRASDVHHISKRLRARTLVEKDCSAAMERTHIGRLVVLCDERTEHRVRCSGQGIERRQRPPEREESRARFVLSFVGHENLESNELLEYSADCTAIDASLTSEGPWTNRLTGSHE